tara:strand:+ start:767 stop:976 length:210 start_codon:yes stop_codon:yes gene_type:complete
MASKEKKQKEIIKSVTETIARGGNTVTIDKLKEILKSMKAGTFKVEKRRGRTPKKKSEASEAKLEATIN